MLTVISETALIFAGVPCCISLSSISWQILWNTPDFISSFNLDIGLCFDHFIFIWTWWIRSRIDFDFQYSIHCYDDFWSVHCDGAPAWQIANSIKPYHKHEIIYSIRYSDGGHDVPITEIGTIKLDRMGRDRAGPYLRTVTSVKSNSTIYGILWNTQHRCSIYTYCTVLYCTVLYCDVLYCDVLYCDVLYSTVTNNYISLSTLSCWKYVLAITYLQNI